jgi:type I restriction enzyme M protein
VVSTAILVFRKDKLDTNVLFVNACDDRLSGKNQSSLRDCDIQNALVTYKARRTDKNYSYLSSLENIQNNNYDLSISRYVEKTSQEVKVDVVELKQERKELLREISDLETSINKKISNISKSSRID